MGQSSEYNKTVKVNLSNENGVNCTLTPINSNIYTYGNNVFTINENNIPIRSQVTDGTSVSFAMFDEKIATVKCQMPTVDKYKKGYKFKITAIYEKVIKYADGDQYETITSVINNDIHLVNINYLKGIQKPVVNLTATVEGATLDPSCNDSMFCNGETTNDKITLKYSVQNNKFNLMYSTGMYYDLFDVRNVKTFNINNKSGSVSIGLNYGNNYVAIEATGDGSTEYEKVAKELDDYHFFECLEYIDFDSVDEGKAFIINRIDNRRNDATLKSLSISNANINFNPNLKNYIVTVPNNISEVTINSQVNHAKASYVSGFGNRKVTLNEGSNTVLVKVKAENGVEGVYTISITREESNNNNLVSISVDDKIIKTSKDKYKYSIKVNNDVSKVNITGVVEHTKAVFTVDNNRDLVEGSNIFTITVTAPNGEKKIYELDIIRDSLISTNTDLKSISIDGYKLDFSSNITKYELLIKDEEELKIDVVTDSNKAKTLITGNSKLKDGSIIKIKVTAEDEKTEKIYEIHIKKESNNMLIYIIIGGVVFVVVILIIVISSSKNKGKKNEITTNNIPIKPEVVNETKPVIEVVPEVKTTVTDSLKKEEVKNDSTSLTELYNSTTPSVPEVKSDNEIL